ncbi:MAG TPA: GAF domain-containing protein, partial [Thermodesulfobacteriota bacterium]|nr:GAF domain-containing protein [Thermodesulfobacteriota bacterium]
MPVTSLYRKLKNEDGDLEILIDLIQAVHRSSDLEEVYKVALDSTIKLENIDVIVVYLVDEERHEAVLEAHSNLPEVYIKRAGRIPYPKGVTWKVINHGKMLNVEDVSKEFDLCPAGRDMGYHGALGIPIFLEKRVIGVIWFLSYREHKFDEKEVSLLSAFGDQIAIAIAKAKYTRELIKAHESVKEQNDRLSLLSRISQEVHQFIDLDKIYTTFLDMVRNVSFVSLAFVYTAVEGKGRKDPLLQAHYVSNNTNFNLLNGIPYLKEISFRVINSGKFGYYKSASDLSNPVTYIGAAFEKRTLLSVPIKLGNQTLGAIHLFSEEGKPFIEQDLDFLLSFVNQFGMAIAKAKLFEEIKKNKEKLRESEQRYNVLAEHIYDLICEIDADARFLFVSSGYKDILGYD